MAEKIHNVELKDGTIFEGNVQYTVDILGEQVLKKISKVDESRRLSAKEIYKLVLSMIKSMDGLDDRSYIQEHIKRSSFRTMISSSARNDDVRVYSVGNGYFYKEEINLEGDTEELLKPRKRIRVEEKLYEPVAKVFCDALNLKSIIIANKRPQELSKQNVPDLLLSDIESGVMAFSDVDLQAVEIKVSKHELLTGAYQALHYLVRCDSSLLLYAVGRSDVDKVNKALIQLHERFGIGIGFIVMEDDYYKSFVQGKIDLVDMSDIEIKIGYRAVPSPVKVSAKVSFLKALGITNIQEMFGWTGDWAS